MKSDLTDIGEFKNYLESRGLVDNSIFQYISVLNKFLTDNPDIDEIDSYNSYIVEHCVKNRSYHVYYALKAYLKFKLSDLSVRNKILKNLVPIKLRDPVKYTVHLTNTKREEVISYLIDERHRLIAKIQNSTGARVHEILCLKRGTITFDNYNGQLAMKLGIMAKGGRRLPKFIFNKELQQEIMDFISEKDIDPIFYFMDRTKMHKNNKDDERIAVSSNYHMYWEELKEACRKANVNPTDFSTHDFRRCVTREVYDMTNRDIRATQDFAGHQRTETTLRYLKHSGLNTIEISKQLEQKHRLNK